MNQSREMAQGLLRMAQDDANLLPRGEDDLTTQRIVLEYFSNVQGIIGRINLTA